MAHAGRSKYASPFDEHDGYTDRWWNVYSMDFNQTTDTLSQGSLVSARMKLALSLPSNITTKHLTLRHGERHVPKTRS